MKFVVILAHQRRGSFNHAVAAMACGTLRERGHEVAFHDLYAEEFDPVLDEEEITAPESELPDVVRKFMDEISAADGLVFVHPNWWGGPPAILRGWIDRVLRQGFAYHFTPQGPIPHFTDKAVFVFSTSNTPRDVEQNVYGDPVGKFWEVIVFGLCGSKSFKRINFEPIILSTPEDRERWLDDVRNILAGTPGITS
jgi:putative NADPH-quinone reductase